MMLNETGDCRKMLVRLVALSIIPVVELASSPCVALAKRGYAPNEILNEATSESGGGIQNDTLNGDSLSELVTNLATWAIGVAVVIFVLKVVLTAVSRMLFGDLNGRLVQEKRGSTNIYPLSPLEKIPIVGAYPPKTTDGSNMGYTWAEIWINFGKQLAICAGAWFLVNLIVSIVSWFLGAAAS